MNKLKTTIYEDQGKTSTASYMNFMYLGCILPDPVNWLLPSVVGLVFPLLTGGENICKTNTRKQCI